MGGAEGQEYTARRVIGNMILRPEGDAMYVGTSISDVSPVLLVLLGGVLTIGGGLAAQIFTAWRESNERRRVAENEALLSLQEQLLTLDSIYSRLMARINDPRDGAWANISNADLVHMWFESLNRARAYGSRVQDESIRSRFHDLYLLMVAWILVLGESPDVKTALSKDVREALDPLIDAVGEKVRGTNA